MKYTIALSFLYAPFIMGMEQKEVNLFLTTALVDNEHKDSRKLEYLRSFEQFKQFGYTHPYIVEGVQSQGPTFLEDHTIPDHVHYFQNNRPGDKNRGKFEGMGMLEALNRFNLDPNSLVYKQTGRYFATADLAEIVKTYPGHDAYVKWSDEKGWILLCAFVFKYQKLQEMYASLDYEGMEARYNPSDPEREWIEQHTTRHIKQAEQEQKLDVFYIPGELGVLVNPANSTTGVALQSQTRY